MKNGFHIDADGYLNGLHIDADGAKHWYLDGQRHRTNGPAVELADGYKSWYLNGQRHRTDGPAIERANGTKEYWVRGAQIPEKKFYSKAFQVQLVMDE
jgi:hypothetical protein